MIQTEKAIVRNRYENTYMHITAINEKGGHKLEKVQGRIQREEKEWKYYIT